MPSISPYYTQFVVTSGINQELNLVHKLYALNDGEMYSGRTWPDGTSPQSDVFELAQAKISHRLRLNIY